MKPQPVTDFEKLIRLLAAGGVEFILVGGVAAKAHGSPRDTVDVDVVYGRSAENIARLVRALASHAPYLRGAPPGLPFVWDERTIQRGLNFTLITSYGAIVLLGEISGGGRYEDLLPYTVQIRLYEMPVLCLNLERLIHVKRAAGRPKDLEAVAELEAIYEERQREQS